LARNKFFPKSSGHHTLADTTAMFASDSKNQRAAK